MNLSLPNHSLCTANLQVFIAKCKRGERLKIGEQMLPVSQQKSHGNMALAAFSQPECGQVATVGPEMMPIVNLKYNVNTYTKQRMIRVK